MMYALGLAPQAAFPFRQEGTSLPLCIDLDGTLVATDTLVESCIELVKRHCRYFFLLPLWLCRGRRYFKSQVAQRVQLDPSALPYNDDLLQYLRMQRDAGRMLYLATGAHQTIAQCIADHTGLFSKVFSSTDAVHLAPRTKAEVLCAHFGRGQFAYAGNSLADRVVWDAAGETIVVRPPLHGARHLASRYPGATFFPRSRSVCASVLRSLRPHQWIKNSLIAVPLLTAQLYSNPVQVLHVVIAIASFSLCASAVYVTNDVLDAASDRRSSLKRGRPFADGSLSPLVGLLLVPSLLLASLALSHVLPSSFRLLLAGYFCVSALYSLLLKRQPILDVLTLAGLYTLRIFAGALAISVAVSSWLLLFSLFFFLSLALVKRVAELQACRQSGEAALSSRSYTHDDAQMLAMIGVASGYLSLLVFALYIEEVGPVLYQHPWMLWGVFGVIFYAINSLWLFAHRGALQGDPLLALVRQPLFYVCGAATLAVLVLA